MENKAHFVPLIRPHKVHWSTGMEQRNNEISEFTPIAYIIYTHRKIIPIFRWTSVNFSILVEVNKACKSKHVEIIITKHH